MNTCTNLPSDISHLIGVLGIYEAVRRDISNPIDKPCVTMQRQLESNIGEVTVASSVVRKTVRSPKDFWAARPNALLLDEWIGLVAGEQISMELALFRTDESEMPRWIQVAFANMGKFGLAIKMHNGIVPIEAIWRPNDPKKVYDIQFQEASSIPHTDSKFINESYIDFLHALQEISDFAKRSDRYEFVPIFESVEEFLKSGGTMSRYTEAVMNDAIFSSGARLLFEALDKCWIFGGMGSWTDIIIQDPDVKREYEAVTSRFFDALTQAILSVANKGRI